MGVANFERCDEAFCRQTMTTAITPAAESGSKRLLVSDAAMSAQFRSLKKQNMGVGDRKEKWMNGRKLQKK